MIHIKSKKVTNTCFWCACSEVARLTMDEGSREEQCSAFSAIFCSVARIQDRVYMARGIYEEAGFEDKNHAFCVVAHDSSQSFYLSVIECVTPVLVMHDKTAEECKFLQKKLADVYAAQKTPLIVHNKEIMQKLYKHVVWVGKYIVFEVMRLDSGPPFVSLGAGCYYPYRGKHLSFLPSFCTRITDCTCANRACLYFVSVAKKLVPCAFFQNGSPSTMQAFRKL